MLPITPCPHTILFSGSSRLVNGGDSPAARKESLKQTARFEPAPPVWKTGMLPITPCPHAEMPSGTHRLVNGGDSPSGPVRDTEADSEIRTRAAAMARRYTAICTMPADEVKEVPVSTTSILFLSVCF